MLVHMPLINKLLPKNKAEFEELLFDSMEFTADTFKIGDKVTISSCVKSGIWEIYKFVSPSNRAAAVIVKTEAQSRDLPSTVAFLDDLKLL